MATESIFHNILIDSKEEVENFVSVMEQSEQIANSCEFPVPAYKNLASEDLPNIFPKQAEKHEL